MVASFVGERFGRQLALLIMAAVLGGVGTELARSGSQVVLTDESGQSRVVIGNIDEESGAYGLAISDAEGRRRGFYGTRADGKSVLSLAASGRHGFVVEAEPEGDAVWLALGRSGKRGKFFVSASDERGVDAVLARPDGTPGVAFRVHPNGDCGVVLLNSDKPMAGLWSVDDRHGLGVWGGTDKDLPLLRIQFDREKGEPVVVLGK